MPRVKNSPGWLDQLANSLPVRRVDSLNYRVGRKAPIVGVVIHYTAARWDALSTARYFAKTTVTWKDTKTGVTKIARVSASAHFVIDRGGAVVQCVALTDTAWHAGPAEQWQGRRLRKGENANDFTIGIELANTGKEPFPQAQMDSLLLLLRAIKEKYPHIGRTDVLGHEEIQSNKSDPGPLFPWQQVADLFEELDEPHEDDDRRGDDV